MSITYLERKSLPLYTILRSDPNLATDFYYIKIKGDYYPKIDIIRNEISEIDMGDNESTWSMSVVKYDSVPKEVFNLLNKYNIEVGRPKRCSTCGRN